MAETAKFSLRPGRSMLPAKDAVATDGEVFEYGDTTLTTVLTSGHTPGTISFIINTTDNGTPHQVAL